MNSLKSKQEQHIAKRLYAINKAENEVDEDSHNMALAAIGHSCLFVQSISASTYPVGGVGPHYFHHESQNSTFLHQYFCHQALLSCDNMFRKQFLFFVANCKNYAYQVWF